VKTKEEILLDELNRLGNFLSVEDEFIPEQLEAIFNAMEVYANQKNETQDN
jgi:hypothetical protein